MQRRSIRASRTRNLALVAALGFFLFTGAGCERNEDQAISDSPTAERVRIESPVTWPSTDPDKLALGLLSDDARHNVACSPVPVLVPRDADLLRSAVLVCDNAGYVFSSDTQHVGVSIHASHIGYEYPGGPSSTAESADALVTDSEGYIRATKTWAQYGTAYLVTLNCDSLAACSPDQVESILAGLAYVGGRITQ